MSKPVVASYCTTFLKPEMMHIYRQITGLAGFDTFVICKERQSEDRFPFPSVEMAPPVRSNFLRRFWLKYIRREPPIVYRGEYGTLSRILERREADLMHVYFGHTGVHLLPFIKRWPRPVTVSFHGMDIQPREGQPGYLDRLRELLQVVPLVLARSESLRAGLIDLGCEPDRIRINRTGIPLDSFPRVEREVPREGDWRLVQACRLIEKKGLDLALVAFARFRKTWPKSTLTIAGEGPLEAELRRQAAALGISEAVTFAGFLDLAQLRELYQGSHLFLHPSRITADGNQEGIPNSMLEAMATGLPVVATLHGGIPEAVEHGRTGLLGAENDVEKLGEHLLELGAAPERWAAMSRAASEDVRDHFEQSEQIAKLESYYRELLAHRT